MATWKLVKIGYGNDVLLDGTKPLPESLVTLINEHRRHAPDNADDPDHYFFL